MMIAQVIQPDDDDDNEGGQKRVSFSGLQTIQEGHEKKIYCIDWSKDIHQDELLLSGRRTSNDDEEDEKEEEEQLEESSVPHDNIGSAAVDPPPTMCSSNSMDADDSSAKNGGRKLYRYMATCAGQYACVYQVPILENAKEADIMNSSSTAVPSSASSEPSPKDSSQGDSSYIMEMVQSYLDLDEKEDFYSCAFAGRSVDLLNDGTWDDNDNISSNNISIDNNSNKLTGETGRGPQLLCVAGEGRTIKVLDTVRQELVATLRGHGNAIYDLKLCPTDDFLLLSASRDKSIRLWNLKLGTMVAIFGGHHAGHRDDVVSVSWHVTGHRFVSSGMDRRIAIWNVGPGTNVNKAIQRSHEAAQRFVEKGQRDNDIPVECGLPIFATSQVHHHCVDCVQFVGDLILSRGSLDETIVLWEPIVPNTPPNDGLDAASVNDPTLYPIPSDFEHLRTFGGMTHADFSFIRFGTDASHGHKTLACGNDKGAVFVWDIDAETGDMPYLKFNWPEKKKRKSSAKPRMVRWVSFSPDGNMFVAATDGGKLFKWDVIR